MTATALAAASVGVAWYALLAAAGLTTLRRAWAWLTEEIPEEGEDTDQ